MEWCETLSWVANAETQYLGYFGHFWSTGYGYVTTSFGNWLGQDKKYLGLRFSINGEEHFGWFRLSVDGEGSPCTLYDYAYEATPNTLIKAGDIGCVIFYADEDSDSYGDVNMQGDTLCSRLQ